MLQYSATVEYRKVSSEQAFSENVKYTKTKNDNKLYKNWDVMDFKLNFLWTSKRVKESRFSFRNQKVIRNFDKTYILTRTKIEKNINSKHKQYVNSFQSSFSWNFKSSKNFTKKNKHWNKHFKVFWTSLNWDFR